VRLASVATCLCLLVGIAGCGDDDEGDAGDTAPPETSEARTDASGAGSGGCRDVKAPRPKPDGNERKPTDQLDPAKTYEVRFRTSCGSFTVRLDVKASPRTSASFVALARRGFFDDTVFHRIVPGFVIQAGDPTATGTGGPGYSTVDKPPKDAAYTTGVVAMAKTGAEPPGTAGSQFYVVTGQDAGLPPDYALLGRVTRGIEVTQQIGELGDPASGGAGRPTKPVVIDTATVSER
jgi:cyclophilin family peptidyl-prolyl cis-trans isomerase